MEEICKPSARARPNPQLIRHIVLLVGSQFSAAKRVVACLNDDLYFRAIAQPTSFPNALRVVPFPLAEM